MNIINGKTINPKIIIAIAYQLIPVTCPLALTTPNCAFQLYSTNKKITKTIERIGTTISVHMFFWASKTGSAVFPR